MCLIAQCLKNTKNTKIELFYVLKCLCSQYYIRLKPYTALSCSMFLVRGENWKTNDIYDICSLISTSLDEHDAIKGD